MRLSEGSQFFSIKTPSKQQGTAKTLSGIRDANRCCCLYFLFSPPSHNSESTDGSRVQAYMPAPDVTEALPWLLTITKPIHLRCSSLTKWNQHGTHPDCPWHNPSNFWSPYWHGSGQWSPTLPPSVPHQASPRNTHLGEHGPCPSTLVALPTWPQPGLGISWVGTMYTLSLYTPPAWSQTTPGEP